MTSLVSIVRHLVSPGGGLNTLVLKPGVRFVSLMTPTQEEALDEAVEIDFKSSADAAQNVCTLRYVVAADVSDLHIWVEAAPGQEVIAKFYGGGEASVLFDGAQKAGVHELSWDGRDATPDLRLLLGGSFVLKGRATVGAKPAMTERKIKIAAPNGWNVGMDYHEGRKHWISDKEVDGATLAQKQLSDGTAYRAVATLGSTATETMAMWCGAAVGHFGGHSSAAALDIHDLNSTKATQIIHPTTVHADEDDVRMEDLPKDALRDMLLIVLCGCNTGNELYVAQSVLNLLHKSLKLESIDGDYGPLTAKAVAVFQMLMRLPRTGQPDAATMRALELAPLPEPIGDTMQLEKPVVFPIQRKLQKHSRGFEVPMKRLDGAERPTGKLDPKTRAALRYLQALCDLSVTGAPDEATLLRLQPKDQDAKVEMNIAQRFVALGADVSIGFDVTIDNDNAALWGQRFWKLMSEGRGAVEAAREALKAVPKEGRKGLPFRFYSQSGIDPNVAIVPARYGRGAKE